MDQTYRREEGVQKIKEKRKGRDEAGGGGG